MLFQSFFKLTTVYTFSLDALLQTPEPDRCYYLFRLPYLHDHQNEIIRVSETSELYC